MNRPFDVIRPTDGLEVPRPDGGLDLDLTLRDPAAPFGAYVLGEELADGVNVALALDQPLLVTGEPGCGKTALAWAVAQQLGAGVFEFHTKSTSVARDLFYSVDTLRRFHDASAQLSEARDASNYISYQALGHAIRSDRTSVVLIDEIDKAPRDFPNDLLNELDRMEFSVPELSPPPRFCQQVRHFVLITSNSERRLPPPFLRRCTYVHIPFPDDEMLARIVRVHTGDLQPSNGLVELAVRRFGELRQLEDLAKPPATGELLAWVRVLHWRGVDDARLANAPLAELPGLEAMVKTLEDHRRLRESSAR
jgi:MoxR-like ATPase